jgi:hypothetical protein
MTVEDIARRIDGLDLWSALSPYHWAIKPRGTALPYFCVIMKGDGAPVKARLLMLEGWQTFHDFIRVQLDGNYGFCSSPAEFPHYELIVASNGEPAKLFRYDTGYVPVEAAEAQRTFCEKMLWEVFGVMMRVESDRTLPLRFATEKAMFARVEGADGNWRDEPMAIPDVRPHVERIAFDKADLKQVKDLPFTSGESIEVDFRILPGVVTREDRPRLCYVLAVVDGTTGNVLVWDRLSVARESGLRGLWESMPSRFLRHLIRLGHVPGEVKVVSGRVFRMLRPICMDVSFRLSLHNSLPRLEAAIKS